MIPDPGQEWMGEVVLTLGCLARRGWHRQSAGFLTQNKERIVTEEIVLTKNMVLEQFRRIMQLPDFQWDHNFYYCARDSGDISGVFLEVRISAFKCTITPVWETFNAEFARLLQDLACVHLRPFRHAVIGERFFERVRPNDASYETLCSRFACPRLALGSWSFQSEYQLLGKAKRIAEASLATRAEYLGATSTLEGVAAKVLYWPKSGPYPSMPARYGQDTRNIRRIIALKIMGERAALLEEYEALRLAFEHSKDPKFKRRHSAFIQRFNPKT